jgi:SAM-dependent methyltransferase
MSSLRELLVEQDRVWHERPLLQRLYRDWFDEIRGRLSPTGVTVELGAGIGRFKEVMPGSIATDIEATPWTDAVIDAERIPYSDGSVGNLVLIDVFHHLPSPARFLDEAVRVLRPGGRAVILDPYCSPVSVRLYRRFHHERTDMDASPFADDIAVGSDPMASNQARATLVFFRHRVELSRRWPELMQVERRRLSFFLYPLSGGFSKPPLLPRQLWRVGSLVERLLAPLAPLLAFRCLIVLERRPHRAGLSRG